MSIAENLAAIQHRIKEVKATRRPGEGPVELIAVSKQQPLEKIEAALVAGQRVFGENRVQEAKAKWPALRERYPDIELHLIGPLQTNKAKEAVKLFEVIQSVDREKLAKELAKVSEKMSEVRCQRYFIQVNVGEEEQKAGVLPKEADDFIAFCKQELKLPVAGLMCIPPADGPAFPYFALLHEMAKRHGLPHLSMGMSGDFEEAIAFGATHVRVGTGVFGTREPEA